MVTFLFTFGFCSLQVLHVRELKKLKHMHDTASKKFEIALEKL